MGLRGASQCPRVPGSVLLVPHYLQSWLLYTRPCQGTPDRTSRSTRTPPRAGPAQREQQWLRPAPRTGRCGQKGSREGTAVPGSASRPRPLAHPLGTPGCSSDFCRCPLLFCPGDSPTLRSPEDRGPVPAAGRRDAPPLSAQPASRTEVLTLRFHLRTRELLFVKKKGNRKSRIVFFFYFNKTKKKSR